MLNLQIVKFGSVVDECDHIVGGSSWNVLQFGIGFNGAETNCRIAHILGILLMNSYHTDIFCSNYYHLQSVHFEVCTTVRLLRLVSVYFVLL